ncbi:hypothetical protein AB1L42_05500 [Thalassoglobus sp. JC818]|uniref:hypothetical protein n=1 Tax=Thalassoglobus sp. JC818 TaxID=3232136 RepID=UPI00345B405A
MQRSSSLLQRIPHPLSAPPVPVEPQLHLTAALHAVVFVLAPAAFHVVQLALSAHHSEFVAPKAVKLLAALHAQLPTAAHVEQLLAEQAHAVLLLVELPTEAHVDQAHAQFQQHQRLLPVDQTSQLHQLMATLLHHPQNLSNF